LRHKFASEQSNHRAGDDNCRHARSPEFCDIRVIKNPGSEHEYWDDIAYLAGAGVAGGHPNVAAQQKLGLRAERRSRFDRGYFDCAPGDGEYLMLGWSREPRPQGEDGLPQRAAKT
jgi:hypothetical protein